MSDTEQASLPEAPDAPGFFVLDHYLADLSLESPFGRLPPALLPDLHHGQEVRVKVSALEVSGDHRVEMFIQLEAAVGERVFFILEMVYRADVRLHQVEADDVEEFLHVQVPDALAPTLRSILEVNGRFAGYVGMQVGDLEFAAAYARLKAAH